MNSFQTQRVERLREILGDPQIQEGELLQSLSEYLESEIASAYGRGYRHGTNAEKPSALQAGRLRPKGPSAGRAR